MDAMPSLTYPEFSWYVALPCILAGINLVAPYPGHLEFPDIFAALLKLIFIRSRFRPHTTMIAPILLIPISAAAYLLVIYLLLTLAQRSHRLSRPRD
jgi:hypothetical protein